MAMLATEIRSRVKWCTGIVTYLLVADLNAITKPALQHLQAFGLGRELCIGNAGC